MNPTIRNNTLPQPISPVPAPLSTPPTPPAAPEQPPQPPIAADAPAAAPAPEAPVVINDVSPALATPQAPDVPPEIMADIDAVTAAAEQVDLSPAEMAAGVDGEAPAAEATEEPAPATRVDNLADFALEISGAAPGSGASIELGLGIRAGTPPVGQDVMQVGLEVRGTAGLSVSVGTGVGAPYVAALDLGVEIEASARMFGNEMSLEFDRTMSNGVAFHNPQQVQEFARLSQELVTSLPDGDARRSAMRALLNYADDHQYSAETNTLTFSAETLQDAPMLGAASFEVTQSNARIRTEGYLDENQNGVRDPREPDLIENVYEQGFSASVTAKFRGRDTQIEVSRLDATLTERVVDPSGILNATRERNSEESSVTRVRLTITPNMLSREAEGELVSLLEQGLGAIPGAPTGLTGAELRSMMPALRDAASESEMNAGNFILEYAYLSQNIPGEPTSVHALRIGTSANYEGELVLPTSAPGLSITGSIEVNGTYLHQIALVSGERNPE